MAGVLSTSRKLSYLNLSCHSKVTGTTDVPSRAVPVFVRYKSYDYSDPHRGPEYQHMKKSTLPTMHFQDSLPRLPIPELEMTCQRYLRAQQELLSATDFNLTSIAVKKFLKEDGIVYQDLLIRQDKENKHTSYISKPWFDMYLSDRRPLPINVNPFLVFKNYALPKHSSQWIRAVNLVISSLRFYRTLKDEILEPEVYYVNSRWNNSNFFRKFTGSLPSSISWYGAYMFKAYPLDMSQYPSLFFTTRVPGTDKDYLKHSPQHRHLLVMKGGHFYVFDVIDKDGNIVGPDVIVSGVRQVQVSKEQAEHPVGILTTEDRNVWAEARKHLEDIGNKEVLDLIDTSIFNLILDDSNPGEDPVRLVRCFLHGDGTNRWFDKSFSMIVTQDGTAGINFEHSWGDGVAVLRFFNDVHVDCIKYPQANLGIRTVQETSVRKLEFKLDDKIKNMIDEAKKKYTKTCNSLIVTAMESEEFGRHVCKPHDLSADAMMQLSFQMAHDSLTSQPEPVATYESCSTAAFKHGRTETVRPGTAAAREFCVAVRRQEPKIKHLRELMINSSKVHSKLIREAAMGQGFDRHLFALKVMAESKGMNPDIFADPSYAVMNHNIMSTSTLSSDNLLLGAFGPVVPDGYGIAYSIWPTRVGAVVTSYKDTTSDGESFVDALKQCLYIFKKILWPKK